MLKYWGAVAHLAPKTSAPMKTTGTSKMFY